MSGRSRSLIPILAAMIAVGPLSVDMYLPGLPAIQREFATDAAAVQATLSTFLIGLAFGQMLYGPISDRIGRKRPLYFGLALYVIGAIGCALSPGIGWLQMMRFLQAAGGCAGMVIARAVVRDLYEGRAAARAYSVLILVMGVAPILAPVVGGQVLVLVGWRAVFWGLAVYGALCLLAVIRILPETRRPSGVRRGFDTVIEDVRGLLRDRLFLGYSLTMGFAMASMHGYFATSPILFIDVLGFSATQYSWIFAANAAGFILFAQVNRMLLRRGTPDGVLRRASAVQFALALALFAVAATGTDGLTALLPPLFGCIAILGLVQPNALAGAMAVGPSRAGTAAALSGTVQYSIGALTAWLSGFAPSGTAVPMAGVILVCVALSGLSRLVLVGRGRPSEPSR